ncbi:protein MCM10 homolog isoform X2 [Nematostella vectensis]|uniref:protein MCM10 homolog isoform X2 n=1 Tax=Nematostella vectensis TaxID=45351 RepID=UPI002077321F|nr:protein MCM10 homolog isoform X2 [Nematostella vectensis]
MEGEDDLDILAALLDNDDDDEGMLDASSSSDPAVNEPQISTNNTGRDSNCSDSSTSPKDSNVDMTEQMQLMAEKIKQLEEALKEKTHNETQKLDQPAIRKQNEVINSKSISHESKNTQKRSPTLTMTEHCKQKTSEPMEALAFFGEKTRVARSSTPLQQSGTKAQNYLPKQQRQLPEHDDKDVTKERFSGLRIINPLISSTVMAQRMEGRKIVPISQIESKLSKGKEKDIDWVTIGALASKLPPRTSSNGNTYGIWKLSDLGLTTANNTVALFLFGEVYKQHWKTIEGSVIALLNANIMPAKEKNSQDVALSLDNPKKLMLMGISKDLGHCKGITRKEKPCTSIVNREYGDFCEYHVNAAYKKIKSNRMEFQSGYGAPNKGALMNKLQKNMSSSSFMYQGKTLTLGAPAPQKSKNVSLKSLGIAGDSEQDTSIKKTKTAKPKQSEAASDFLRDLLALPTPGTRNLIKHLHKDEEERKPKEEKTPAASASQLLRNHHKEVNNSKRPATTSSEPKLGRGIYPGLDIVFDAPTPPPKTTSSAKLRALSVVKQKGPIEKEDPNAVRKKRSPSAIQTVGKRVDKDQSDGESDIGENTPKRRRLLGPEFSGIDLNSAEGKRLLCARSLHVGQVEEAQAERQEQYFSSLEKKEQLEDKLKSIKEIIVKVYCCKKCDYVAESASDICFKENHPLKQTKAPKRFFSCKNCKQRTISYGARMPKLTCKNCGEMNYERTSMFMEKQGPKIAGETLLVRGEEHSKFMNSLR